MSLLSNTTFGSVYRIETPKESPPTWHEVQCAVLGLAHEDSEDMQVDPDEGKEDSASTSSRLLN